MQEQLKILEQAIIDSQDMDVKAECKYLEPLFAEVYEETRKENFDDLSALLKLSQLENKLSRRILPVWPKLEPPIERDSDEALLQMLVYYTRKKAEDLYHCNIKEDSLRTRSKDFSQLLSSIAKGLEVPACILDMASIFHLPVPHYVVLAYVNGFYLLDITYQEFFLMGYNFPTRYYEFSPYNRICEVGGRMLGERVKSATLMIEDGYLPVSSTHFKNYCDAYAEFGSMDKCQDEKEYFQKLLEPIQGSSDKTDRILLSKVDKK